MHLNKYFFIITLILSLCLPAHSEAVLAFPGAEGFGKDTIGGRGGTVIKVTNTNDSGTGSLRAAVEASGARTVVFDTSGIIVLENDLYVRNPYITIAGQTSPGGITVTGRKVLINTHDVIIRHIRFRVGTARINYDTDANGDIIYYSQAQQSFPPSGGTCQGTVTTAALGYPCAKSGGADPEVLDGLNIIGQYWEDNEAYNIIIDHCSISWGVDETMSITGGVLTTTVQWSIISEGLSKAGHPKGEHSKGLMVSGKYVYPNTISLHHNYIAHNRDRSPLLYSPAGVDTTVDVVNNVIYNWYGGLSPMGERSTKVNWVYNYAKPGNSSHSYSYEVAHYAGGASASPQLYVFGNIGSTRTSQSEPHWNVGDYWMNSPLSTAWQKSTAWTAPAVTTAVMSEDVANCILTAVGATAPSRDSVDSAVVADFAAGTGDLRSIVTYPDDFPTVSTPAAPADTDNDGMSDTWEDANGFDKNIDDSAGDKDGDGYTNLEEYLHYLSIRSYTYNSACMPDITAPKRIGGASSN